MFQLEPIKQGPVRIDRTDNFVKALAEKGIRVERVYPVFSTQNLSGSSVHEICSKQVDDIDFVIGSLVKVNPYVVFVREITEVKHPAEGVRNYIVRFDFIAPLNGE